MNTGMFVSPTRQKLLPCPSLPCLCGNEFSSISLTANPNPHPNPYPPPARTPGRSSVAARKLAPRDTSFLLKFQPNTPPPPA